MRPSPNDIHGYTTITAVPIFRDVEAAEKYWDAERWPNFSVRELACRGTGRVAWVPEALDRLQALRRVVGPMIVVSAYRSPEHNRAVKGARQSRHMQGDAFDVSMANHDPHRYVEAATAAGFDGIGTYPKGNFVHVDARGVRARWGDAFPRAQVAFSGAEEPRPASVRPDVQTAGGGAVAGGVTAVGLGAVASGATDGLAAMGDLDPTAQIAVVIAVGLLLVAFVAVGPRRILNRLGLRRDARDDRG